MDFGDPFSEFVSRMNSLTIMTNLPQDVDYFRDLTHPPAFDFQHSSWEAFARELTEACFPIFLQNSLQYTGVHALLLNWADDDLGTDKELIDFHAQLKKQFNFTAEIWKIPSQQSEHSLEAKLWDVK